MESNVVSVFQAGAVFGAMFSAWIGNAIGRRYSLLINIILYLIGAIFMTAAMGKSGIALLYVGRILTGWGVGASTMLVPVYVAECSPAHIRGRLVGLYEVGVQFGTMVSRLRLSPRLLTQTSRSDSGSPTVSCTHRTGHPSIASPLPSRSSSRA